MEEEIVVKGWAGRPGLMSMSGVEIVGAESCLQAPARWLADAGRSGFPVPTNSNDTVRVLMAPVPNGSISLIFLFQRFLISLFGTDKRWKKQK